MLRRPSASAPVRRRAALATLAAVVAAPSLAVNLPVDPQWRQTAERVAAAGVPLAELAPDAPDAYTVKRGDTLWGISTLFLRSPWRWPELWGMNLEQIRNPHLIYPGQVLVLERSEGVARLRVAQAVDGAPSATVRLSPRVREELLPDGAIAAIPLHLIAPFLSEAVVFDTDALAAAPRVVAAPEGRVLMSRGENAYVLGDIAELRDWRIFRTAVPLRDPDSGEVLGFEARFVGSAEYVRQGENRPRPDGGFDIVPATFRITGVREEVGVGDRLAPVPTRELASYAPHAPARPLGGRIVSIYGDGLTAGQNQIVALNRGRVDGVERGHVLALWRDGAYVPDATVAGRPLVKLPDERHGTLFVFSVFERVSYALIVAVQNPVRPGDRFSQP